VDRAASLLKAAGFKVRGARLPEDRDPGSYGWDSSELREIIAGAKRL